MNSGEGSPRGVDLICAEPFRLFFPTGIIVSVCGVGLWPMLYAGLISFPPHVPHARVMVEGFLGSFMIGFLGTALPRLMETPPLRKMEVGMIYVLLLGTAGSQLTGRVAWGDGFFLATLLVFILCMGTRLLFLRRDLPPPGFVLAGMGIAGAVAGLVILLAGQVVTLPLFLQTFASLLLYEGMVLFALLGVGGFFFPMMLGTKSGEIFPESASPSRAWQARAAVAAGCGLLLWGSFALEAGGLVREGRFLRVAVAAAFLCRAVAWFRRGDSAGTLAFSLRVAVLMVPAGLLATGFFPSYQKGFDHLMLAGGFGLAVLTVGGRVVLGHAGRLDLAKGRSRAMRWIVWIVLVAAATRASADPLPQIAVSHHLYAAILWMTAAATWAGWLFPKLRQSG